MPLRSGRAVTGAAALAAARSVRDKKIVCVTCPQGMHWEVAQMRTGPFPEIAELAAIRDRWIEQGLDRVPMDIDARTRKALEEGGVTIVRGRFRSSGRASRCGCT